MKDSTYNQIYTIVQQIPKGKVATYGQIASMVEGTGPRQVGYALHATPKEIQIPWHRVINAKGEVSPRSQTDSHFDQRALLEQEGIVFNKKGKIDLQKYRWE